MPMRSFVPSLRRNSRLLRPVIGRRAFGAPTNPLTRTEKENLGAVEAATEDKELRHYEHTQNSRTTGKRPAK